jgi:hypothetical protein
MKKRLGLSTMKFSKTIATAAIILSFISVEVLAAESPAAIPSGSVAAVAATATPDATPTKLKPVKKRFLLSHSSSVYEQPDKTSAVIGYVHRRAHVRVTAVTGDWLRIQLSSSKVGFIPASAAE